jgi:ADP-ribosyl-[dinitrogen reductase] hydrolase
MNRIPTVSGTPLSTAQSDRSAGVLLAMAAGDALGAGYEFGPPLGDDVTVVMDGGGSFGWAPGEWTDDTSMAMAIAEVSAQGVELRSAAAQDRIAARWADWAATAKDVGIQTRDVLSSARRAASERGEPQPRAADLHAAARALHDRTGKTAGNGSLMRTAPVALAYLGDPDGLVEAATALSALTHADPEAGEACVLWCLAIRHAVLHGTFDGVHEALDRLAPERAAVWRERLIEAEAHDPAHFDHNGWVVQALQGAWSAIARTPVPDDRPPTTFAATHLRHALEAAVRGGRDTDTVAAIAGSLLGARWGSSAVPTSWRRRLHGWPGLRARDLVRLGVMSARRGQPDRQGWPSGATLDYTSWETSAMAPHPHDDHVWLTGVGRLAELPDGVDAVVSLCRLGVADVPVPAVPPGDHVEVWLVDKSEPEYNPHLDYVLREAAGAVAELRSEGKTVLLHCVQAQSRTPTVAALYGAQVTGRPPLSCLDDICEALPQAHPKSGMLAALARLTP